MNLPLNMKQAGLMQPVLSLYREKDDDEGIPSETEEDKKLLESKAKEMRGKKQSSFCIILLKVLNVSFVASVADFE